MQIVRIPNPNGVDDIKIISESDSDRILIKQLAEAGTLSNISRGVSDSVIFRAISINDGNYASAASLRKKIGKFDFEVRQNENEVLNMTFTADNVPLDLTLYTQIKLQVKSSKGGAPLLTLSLGSGLTVTGSESNLLNIVFSAQQTLSLKNDSYYYDIMLSTPETNIYYVEGKISPLKSTTR